MVGRRRYDDGCAVAHGLDLVGERWALLIVRELLLGPKRFTDLRAGLPTVSPDVLTQRLRDLREEGIVTQRKLPPPAAARVYELTEWGYELEPVIIQLGRWSSRSPTLRKDSPLSADSLILAFRTCFEPGAAGELELAVTLRMGEDTFQLHLADRVLEAGRGAAERPDLTLETDPDTLSAVVWNGLDPAQAQGLSIEGDPALARRLFQLFPLPEPAPAPE